MKTILPVLLFTFFCFPLLSRAGVDGVPTLDFSANVTSGCNSLTVSFSDNTFTDDQYAIVSYTWDFGDGTVLTDVSDGFPTHTYSSPGSYNVTMSVVAVNGWTGSYTRNAYINIGSGITVDLGPDRDICDGSTLTLSGGNPGANILWNTGENTPEITIWDGGLYSVIVSKDGCTAKDTVNITWKPELSLNFGFNKVSGCLPVDMKFTDSSTACSGSITGWLWDFGDGSTSTDQNPVHTFISKGQFPVRLTVTASSGSTLSRTKKVTINPPAVSVDLGPDTTICFGESVTLDAANPGAVYSWNTGENSQQITVLDDGAYSVMIDVDGCTASDTVNVRTSASVVANWGYSAGGNCLPVSVTFSDSSSAYCGQSIVSWKWDFGDGSTSTQRNPLHIYTTANAFNVKLTVTSSGGSNVTRTKKVTVNNTPFSIDLPATLKVCRGGSIVLDAVVTGAQYAWTPAFGLSASDIRNPTLIPAMSSWYRVDVTKCSVTNSDSVFIMIDSISKPLIFQDGNTLKSPDAAVYQWYFEGTAIDGGSTKSIRVDKAGYYMLKATNNNGCINQSDSYFYIPVSGNEKTSSGLRIKISPNPARGVFNILFSVIPTRAAKVSVYDVAGKKLMVTSAQDHVNRMNMSGFMKGLYFIEIIINTERTITPVVIQ